MPKSAVFKTGSVGELAFNVVPLIDVIFVLILFLILTTQISSAQFADLVLPSPLDSQVLVDKKAMDAKNRVIINVLSKSKLNAKDALPSESGVAKNYDINGNIINVGDVERLVREIEAQRKASLALGYKDFFIEIRGDKRVGYEYYQPVMLAASKAGVAKVNITATADDAK